MDLLNTLKVSWGGCENFGVDSTDSNLKCAHIDVPMDYHDSSAGKARLAVIKYSATAPNKRGTIFFNPGDPPICRSPSPINVPFLQAVLAIQESMPPSISVRVSVKVSRVNTI